MRRYLMLSSLILATVFLTGCSLVPAKQAAEDVPVVIKSSSVLKSMDGGKNWEFKGKTSEKISLDSIDVLSMDINPYDGKNIYIGMLKNGIFKTDDGGESWSLLNFPSEKVYGLQIDPIDSRIIYASGLWQKRGKIFKSINGGAEWEEIYTAPSDGPLVISLALSRKNSKILYATTSDSQVLKSTDAGVSWKNIYVAASPVLKIAIDGGNDNLLYLNLLSGKVLKSRDGGNTISELSGGIGSNIEVIEADLNNAGWIYAAGKSGLFRSKNAGESWENLKTLGDANVFPVKAVAINPENSKEIVYGAAQAVYKSIDSGVTWTPFQLQTTKDVSMLKYSNEAGVIYLGLRKK